MPKRKLSNKQAAEIKLRYSRETVHELAEEYGVTIKAVRNAIKRKGYVQPPGKNSVEWNCGARGHLWHDDIIIPSRVTECDWCTVCQAVRPGYKDPQEKWD
jgi:predicted transcriptional regulator